MEHTAKKRAYGSGRLYRRGQVWWMQYSHNRKVIRESTGCSDRQSAERILNTQLARFGRWTGRWNGRRARGETWVLNTDELHTLRGPVVYILRSNDQVLYVGSSSQGLCRPLASQHHVLGAFVFQGPEELIVYSCRNPEEARALEARLIAQLHPSLNRRLARQDPLREVLHET